MGVSHEHYSEARAKVDEQAAERHHRSAERSSTQAVRLCSFTPIGIVKAPRKGQVGTRYCVRKRAQKELGLDGSDPS
jgi:hypothetical protein